MVVKTNLTHTSQDNPKRINPTGILVLENGTSFQGYGFGFEGIATGELCFNTGMTGYQEVFTDPSYYGQLMITTNAHIGNYGIKNDEVESDGIKIAGLICKNFNHLNVSYGFFFIYSSTCYIFVLYSR